MRREDIKRLLDERVVRYNQSGFIANDPICVPHAFAKQQDIEIAGFFAAVLAWGQRKTIINKSFELMQLMDNAPHAFILGHQEEDLKRLTSFKHRTFNTTDTLYFIAFLKHHYERYESLEMAFTNGKAYTQSIEESLNHFFSYFFSLPYATKRTEKHIASPARKSACKRLNMFLRWMVRKDDNGVDFGIWKHILPAQLICPCDLHVDRVARKLGLITRKATDWQTALELTEQLRAFDPEDPVKYDFALFGLGIEEQF
jgi:uncharacterized protein (TIGR02757 family)